MEEIKKIVSQLSETLDIADKRLNILLEGGGPANSKDKLKRLIELVENETVDAIPNEAERVSHKIDWPSI